MADETGQPPEFEGPVDLPDPAPIEAAPLGGVTSSYYRNLAIGAVALLVVCGGLMFFSSRGGGSDSSSSSSDDSEYADVTTTLPELTPEDFCVLELSDWMPWVTGPGSPMDAMAEWGAGAEEYQIIMSAWQTYNGNLYRIGKDEASDMAYDTVEAGCSTMTYDYTPGHTPPG
jgi:hypothetical protein